MRASGKGAGSHGFVAGVFVDLTMLRKRVVAAQVEIKGRLRRQCMQSEGAGRKGNVFGGGRFVNVWFAASGVIDVCDGIEEVSDERHGPLGYRRRNKEAQYLTRLRSQIDCSRRSQMKKFESTMTF